MSSNGLIFLLGFLSCIGTLVLVSCWDGVNQWWRRKREAKIRKNRETWDGWDDLELQSQFDKLCRMGKLGWDCADKKKIFSKILKDVEAGLNKPNRRHEAVAAQKAKNE